MGKTIVIGIAGIFFIGMTVFNLVNLNTLKTQEKSLSIKKNQVTKLITTLDQEKLENEILVDKNVALETKVIELRDSIAMLKVEIRGLKSQFAFNKNEILELNSIIAGYEEKYQKLELQIAEAQQTIQSQIAAVATPKTEITPTVLDFGRGGLEYAVASNFVEDIVTAKGAEQASTLGNFVSVEEIDAQTEAYEMLRKEKDYALQKIQRLEEEKIALETELNNLYKLKQEKLIQTKEIKEVIVDRTANEAKFEKLAQVVNETIVKFNKVSIRKNRYGKQLEKVGGRNWRYTVIEIGLDGPHLNDLLNQRFIVKLKDKDSNKTISYLEVNENYPYNTIEKDGLEVNFDGNLLEVVHHNNQKKAGKNYEIVVNYVDDNDEEYTLLNGVTDIIRNAKPVFD